MIYNIRGALGTQVLETAYCVLVGLIRSNTLTAVAINTANSTVANHNYVSRLLQVPVPVKLVQATNKQAVWKEGRLLDVFLHAKETRLPLRVAPIPVQSLVHMRTGDRFPVSIAAYQPYLQGASTIGDAVGADPIMDWRKCLGARRIVGAVSAFTISALLFDTNKEMLLFKQQDGPLPVPQHAIEAVDSLRNVCPNLKWI